MTSRPSTRASLIAALSSWRFGAVTLLSLSSGAPLGLVLTGVPAWLAMTGVDIKTIGLVTLAQAPYAFKFVWAPLFDRYRLPFFGRKRCWIFVWQLALALAVGALAVKATSPNIALVAVFTVLIAFASASQDIAIDAYAVESLRPAEQGLAAGSRTALYRVGMWLAGNISISVAPYIGWDITLYCQAAIYLALIPVTIFAPEPEALPRAPKTLRDAVWLPFVAFLQRPAALQIAAFLVLYKLADNLAMALIRPFLIHKGYAPIDVGVASGTIGLFGIMLGTFVGGILTISFGLGRTLWLFGILQALAGLGYAVLAGVEVSRPLMYGAVAIEAVTVGLATGALDVLLLRLTDRRFSATQYALLSSIFAMGRTIAGPLAGFLVAALDWQRFFVITVFCAIPGLVMLRRFAPFGAREISTEILDEPPVALSKLSRRALLWRGFIGFVFGTILALGAGVAFAALAAAGEPTPRAKVAPWSFVFAPVTSADWLKLGGALAAGLVIGFGVAAYAAARRSRAAS